VNVTASTRLSESLVFKLTIHFGQVDILLNSWQAQAWEAPAWES
jgi:hypothetical protein